MSTLREQLIKLANDKPELRGKLIPILKLATPKNKTAAKTDKEVLAWIAELHKKAKAAEQEMKKKEKPGMALSSFIGFLRGYEHTDWYEKYYG